MKKIDNKSLIIEFLDKQHEVKMKEIKELRFSALLRETINSFGIKKFIVLDQVHVATGYCVEDRPLGAFGHVGSYINMASFDESWFEYQGDFLITNQKNCALVVLTADCVPLILYDSARNVIAVVHSGWKGTVAGVAQNAVAIMQKNYGSNSSDIECFFGPSAGSCCYQVTSEFIEPFKLLEYGASVFVSKGESLYFNNGDMVRDGLKKVGIKPENIYTSKEQCTVCTLQYCSFRRDKEKAGRQITFAALR